MEVDNDPNAQGTQAGELPNSGEGQQAQVNGVEKRIAELVGRAKAAEEQANRAAQVAADKDSQIAELVRAVTAQQAGQLQQVPADDLDPEMRKQFERFNAPVMSRLEQTIARLEAQLGQQQVRSVAASVGDPRIEARAQQLMDLWQQKRLSGWTPEDAVRYAAGEIALAERSAASKTRDEKGRFNAGASGNLSGGSALPAATPSTTRPADLDRQSVDKQIAFYEKSLDGKTF